MEHGIRLVIMDMDGTLLDDAKEIGPGTAAAIRAGVAEGMRFVLASARPFCSAHPYAAGLGLDTPLICYNGALVKAAVGGTLLSRPLSADVARVLAERCKAEGLYAKVYDDDAFFVDTPTDETLKYSRAYRVPYRTVGNLAGFIAATGLAPLSFVIHADPARLPSLRAELEEQFAGRLNCHCPNEHAIHISSPEASKLAAIQLLAGEWGIGPHEVMAVGDGSNDLEMLRWAGLGVALGNASQDLLAAADWVGPDNNHDGVGVALERFLALPCDAAASESAATVPSVRSAPGAWETDPAPVEIVVERSVETDVPPERVWEVFAALDRWPRWNPVCLAAGHLAGRRWTRGSSILIRFKMGPFPFPVKLRLVTVEPGRRVVWLGSGPGLQGLHTFTFEGNGGGTRVVSHERFSGRLLPLVRLAGFSQLAGRMTESWLAAMKREAEQA